MPRIAGMVAPVFRNKLKRQLELLRAVFAGNANCSSSMALTLSVCASFSSLKLTRRAFPFRQCRKRQR